MPNCSVAVCKNYNRKTKGKDVIYHSFPKDPIVRNKWIHACKRGDKINVKNATICSEHFLNEDYVHDLQAELLNLPPKRRLKPDAVPSVHLAPSDEQDTSQTVEQLYNRMNRYKKRESRKRALNTLSVLSPKKRKVDISTETDIIHKFLNQENLSKKLDMANAKNEQLRKEILVLKNKNKLLHLALAKKTQEMKTLEIKKNKEVKMEVRNILKQVFSQTQIECLLSPKMKPRWTQNDIAKALTLRSLSKKCYVYMRTCLGIPLPALSTLRRWVSCSFHCHPGVLHDVLQLMKNKAESLTVTERLCVISFDEMNVDSRVCYDQEMDMIFGPHSQVQVAMSRALCGNWKQPVYYSFDTTMTGELLKQIIKYVQSAGFIVVGVVSDLGGKNAKVWNELQIHHQNTCFDNPTYTGQRIWVFADVPHMIKLLRNHLLDDGIILPGGKCINKSLFEKLLSLDCGEMKLCPKLTPGHVNVFGRDRQRVHLACQLFSNHVAQAISYLLPDQQESADFIKLVNDAFDILNSRIPRIDDRPIASAFGMHTKAQEEVLRTFHTVCEKMRLGKRTTLLPFQKGFLMSVRSLLCCYSDLQKTYNIKYIFTARFNQDCLENFFSQIRAVGRTYDHPLPVDFKNRLRLLLMSRNIKDITFNSTCPVAIDNSGDSYLTSHLFIGLISNMKEALEMIEGNLEVNDVTLDVSSSHPIIRTSECSDQSLRYLAGYIAYRCRSIDTSLGHSNEELKVSSLESDNGWVEKLSRGGLIIPTDSWLNTIKELEVVFALFHGDSVSKERNVVQGLCRILSDKFPSLSPEIIKLYVRLRTFIRIRQVNAEAKALRCTALHNKKARKWQASFAPPLK